ncbi:MAG: ABC-F family ATP-binding cassette domain-containing protein [Deltaproteobacteria bacterium]|nr:ABC-F family ATP-binding cassette domain-containing protein [Deltaproteobacteria bacterium]
MSLVSLQNVSKQYADRTILDEVSITIEARDRVGLIGVNGAGKSTLLKILLGFEEPDGGIIQRKRNLTTGLVPQNPMLDPAMTVGEIVRSGHSAHETLKRRFDAIAEALAQASETGKTNEDLETGGHDDTSDNTSDEVLALLEEQAHLSEQLTYAAGWETAHRADAVMNALGLPPADRLAASLSLGEQRRVAIARAILAQPELLVLDEPTNHVDVATIEWLEDALADWPGALILVTHDRFFLDKVANRHAEIDRGTLRLYDGNYADYLAARAIREQIEESTEHKRQRAIESELTWVRRRAPARTTKQRARLERFDAMVAARPQGPVGETQFRLPHPKRLGKTILELRGVSVSIGERRLIDNLDLGLKHGDRLGIVGPNGIGKTTLLRVIQQERSPDCGEVVVGQNTSIAYADQRRILDDDNTVLEEVAGDSDVVWIGEHPTSVHAFLDGLLFEGATQRTKIGALSGGERSRVALAKALRVTANLLILDEPTNDLDLPTLRVLEDALVEYPGCALIVSHDRYFLDRVATGILAFEGDGRVVLYEGSYDSYRRREQMRRSGAPSASSAKSKPSDAKQAAETRGSAQSTPHDRRADPEKPRLKRTYKEQREFESMEERILEAEGEVETLEALVSDPQSIRELGPKIQEKLQALEGARARVETLYARWAELSELS